MLKKKNDREEIGVAVNTRSECGMIIFSIIFGLIYSLAYRLYAKNEVEICFSGTVVSALLCFVALNLIWMAMHRVSNWHMVKADFSEKKFWMCMFLASVSVNVLCLFIYFPGVGMNDGLNLMLAGMKMSNQFPVFYCAFVMVLVKIGEAFGTLQISVALYSISQLFVVSAVYAWIALWFMKKCAPKWMKWCFLIYFLAEPILAMYAISMLKDTLFSLFLFAFMLFVYDLVIERQRPESRWYWLALFVVIAGMLYLRNNGSCIVFPMLIILFFCCKNCRKQMFLFFLAADALVLLSKAAMAYFGAEQLFQEIVAIPLQQMAAVVAYGGEVTAEQADFLGTLMPLDKMAELYNPVTADAIKWNGDFCDASYLNAHKKEFLMTWLQMLPANLKIYVKAYLQQTFWFWAPVQQGTVQCLFSIETVSSNDWLPAFLESSGIHDQPILGGALNTVLRKWYGLGAYFLREGVCFWVMLGTLLLNILKNKNIRFIIVYGPIVLLWISLMLLTPVASSMRYVFAYVYSLPFFVGLLFVRHPDSPIVKRAKRKVSDIKN